MNFDLNFVTKFKNLSSVRFYYNIPKETMSFLLENCNYLKFYGMQRISIFASRNENGRFEIDCYNLDIPSDSYESPKIIEFDCIEEVIEHYYQHNLFSTPWD